MEESKMVVQNYTSTQPAGVNAGAQPASQSYLQYNRLVTQYQSELIPTAKYNSCGEGLVFTHLQTVVAAFRTDGQPDPYNIALMFQEKREYDVARKVPEILSVTAYIINNPRQQLASLRDRINLSSEQMDEILSYGDQLDARILQYETAVNTRLLNCPAALKQTVIHATAIEYFADFAALLDEIIAGTQSPYSCSLSNYEGRQYIGFVMIVPDRTDEECTGRILGQPDSELVNPSGAAATATPTPTVGAADIEIANPTQACPGVKKFVRIKAGKS